MKTEHLGKIQYLLLLDIENILVMLKNKQKKGAVFILCELFIMPRCARWCHPSRSMINHNGIQIKHEESSNVMVCIVKSLVFIPPK